MNFKDIFITKQVDFLNKSLLEKLTEFITSLIKHGNLGLARALRFVLSTIENFARGRNSILSGPSSFLSTKSDVRDCFLTLICESINLDHDFCWHVLIVVIWFVTASIFFIAELIPHSQVWQLESDSSTSQFTQLQVRWGGVTQSISQNSHPQE